MPSKDPVRASRRIYVSAAFARRKEISAVCRQLHHGSRCVVSTWHEEQHDVSDGCGAVMARRVASRDLEELRSADLLVVFTQPADRPLGRGGRHVELGAALAWNIPVVVVGPHEHVFHGLAARTFACWTDLLDAIGDRPALAAA